MKLAIRVLARRPVFLIAVVATLALGIGANTAVFSMVNALILHPLPVSEPDRLLAIYTSNSESPYGGSPLTLYRDIVADNSTLAGTAAYSTAQVPLTDATTRRDLNVALVSDNYFSVLGVHAAIGRTMLPGDPQNVGANPVVVLSNKLWRDRFGGDPTAIGRVIHIAGQPLTVIGVAPEKFAGTDLTNTPDLWMPMSMVPLLSLPMLSQQDRINPDMPFFSIVARLAPGVDAERATADIATIAQRVDWSSPFTGQVAGKRPSISLVPITEAASSMQNHGALVRFIRVLVAIGVLTLLLACLNVANLLMVRAGERARELGIRAALGARDRRLVQQLFTESVILAVLGGAVGVIAAVVTLRAASAFTLPGRITLGRVDLTLHASVLGFAIGVSLLTAVVFGLAPAVLASRGRIADVLRNGEGGTPAVKKRAALLAVQVAISLALVAGAAILVHSVRASLDTDVGFDPQDIAAVSVATQFNGTSAANNREYMAVITALQHTSGVTHAAASTQVPIAPMARSPFGPGALADSSADYAIGTTAASGPTTMTGVSHIMGDYFRTMGIALVAGRPFNADDQRNSQRVVILNESAARALAPGTSPIGKQVHGGGFLKVWYRYTVVGVVRDTKYRSLQDSHLPFAYVPITQEDITSPHINFIARSDNPQAMLATMQRTVTAIAPDLKLADTPELRPRLLSDQIAMLVAPQRLAAMLLSGFALLALCISGVGIYGTVSYITARRSAEIGIRMALGARTSDVLMLVLTQTAVAIAIGMGIGVAGTALAAKFLASWVSNVGALDPASVMAAIGVVALFAAVAAIGPCWRAMRIDPVAAIRTAE